MKPVTSHITDMAMKMVSRPLRKSILDKIKQTMNKPIKQTKSYLDYFEIKDYIIEKYNCEKDEDKCWDYMCNTLEIRNDSYSYIPTDINNVKLKNNKFIEAVKEEFGDNPNVWISW